MALLLLYAIPQHVIVAPIGILDVIGIPQLTLSAPIPEPISLFQGAPFQPESVFPMYRLPFTAVSIYDEFDAIKAETSTTGDVPLVPDVPFAPEEPDVPEPLEPEVPFAPEEPDVPEPLEPDVPFAPDEPDVPLAPLEPDVPEPPVPPPPVVPVEYTYPFESIVRNFVPPLGTFCILR